MISLTQGLTPTIGSAEMSGILGDVMAIKIEQVILSQKRTLFAENLSVATV